MRRVVWAGVAVTLIGCAGGGGARRVSPRIGTVAMNSEVSGILSSSDPRLNDGSVYQAWRFRGTQGQFVQIDVMSDAFDAFAILQGPNGNEIARDDDNGDGTNARISVALPVTGQYRIIANTFRDRQFGPYRLRLTGNVPGARAVAAGTMGTILRGQMVTGRLTLNDARLADNSLYQAWAYYGTAGETITLDVVSGEFDAYAVIQDASGNVLARDDDSGDDTNARITYTLPYTGQYRLIANTYRPGAVGTYTLMVR